MRILVVEGDKESRSFIQKGLSGEGFAVDAAADGEEALNLARRIPYDVLLLNAHLPDRPAISLARVLRQERYPTFIILHSPQVHDREKIEALYGGADEFLVKPTLKEMAAMLYVHLRHLETSRSASSNPTELVYGELRMDLLTRRIEYAGHEILLTKKESELLEFLMRHPGQVFSTRAIAQQLWNINFNGDTNVVERHVSRIRGKLAVYSGARHIQTVRGWGYRLAA